jgi:hypothetical protein
VHVSSVTMLFYAPVRREVAVKYAAAYVSKGRDGAWRAFLAIRLDETYEGVDGDHFYRVEELRETRSGAIRAIKALAADYLGAASGQIPEGITLRLNGSAELALTADLDLARPFAREERAA